MAFVKLDTDMLDSTIWMDRPAREVFITSLLLAQPREFSEPQKQIAVRSLEYTGWEAPAGWYGFVPASGPGIVHRSQVPKDEGDAALERLGSPEPESRSQAFEGRRMIRIDGGYLILNYMKFRDKDHTAPLRSARYRARLKAEASEACHTVTPSRHAVTSHTRDMLYASVSGSDLKSDPDPEGVQGKPKRGPHAMPADFAPDDTHRALATKYSLDLDEVLQDVRDWCAAKGARRANWAAVLRTWLKREGRKGTHSAPQQSLSYQFPSDWIPTKEHRAKGLELGLTVDEILARADDCRLKPIKQGFTDPDQHFYRELAWAKRDKDADRARRESYANRKDFETPGHGRNSL